MGHSLSINDRWMIFQRYIDVIQPCLDAFYFINWKYHIYIGNTITGWKSDTLYYWKILTRFESSIRNPISNCKVVIPMEILSLIEYYLQMQYFTALCKYKEVRRLSEEDTSYHFNPFRIDEEYREAIANDVLRYIPANSIILGGSARKILHTGSLEDVVSLQQYIYPELTLLVEPYKYSIINKVSPLIWDIAMHFCNGVEKFDIQPYLEQCFAIKPLHYMSKEIFKTWLCFNKGLSFVHIPVECALYGWVIPSEIMDYIFNILIQLHLHERIMTLFIEYCETKFQSEYGAIEDYPSEFEDEYCDNGYFYGTSLEEALS